MNTGVFEKGIRRWLIVVCLGLSVVLLLAYNKYATHEDRNIYSAIYDGDVELLRELVAEDPNKDYLRDSQLIPAAADWWIPKEARSSQMTARRKVEIDRKTYQMIEVLLEHGANPNEAGRFLLPALGRAMIHNNRNVVILLSENGAIADALVGPLGRPILYVAVAADYMYAGDTYVNLLLSYGADVNIVDGDGNTVLHLAVKDKIPAKYVLPLIAGGLDTKIANKRGETALEIAERENLAEYIELLKTAAN